MIIARVVIWLSIALSISGSIVYLTSDDGANQRIWHDLVERPGGKMTIRFTLQPILAAIAALHDGLKDAQAGRSAYLWTIARNSNDENVCGKESLQQGAQSCSGIIMDAIYQVMVLKTYYPGENVFVANVLAFFRTFYCVVQSRVLHDIGTKDLGEPTTQ